MITVFTSTYNRAKLLSRLYRSLISQVYQNFEWLIVDDGSTDQTRDLVSLWQAEGKVSIRYVKQTHGGKHRAINKGVQIAKGEWFFIVDSDDYLPADSLMWVCKYANQVRDCQIFAGVVGNKCFLNGKKRDKFTYEVLDIDSVSFREKLHMKGDMAEVFKTEVLRKYPFPEFAGENFLTEAMVYNQIARKYKLRYFNQNIYICDYLEDGLSMNIRRHHRNSPKGTMLFYSSSMRDNRFGFFHHIKDAINYWRYTWNHKGARILPPWWAWFFYPFGIAVYCYDCRREYLVKTASGN